MCGLQSLCHFVCPFAYAALCLMLCACEQMLQRDLKMASGNVTETAAWGKFCAKQSARSRRTPLEIAHEHEKFGRESRKPCALCEQVSKRAV